MLHSTHLISTNHEALAILEDHRNFSHHQDAWTACFTRPADNSCYKRPDLNKSFLSAPYADNAHPALFFLVLLAPLLKDDGNALKEHPHWKAIRQHSLRMNNICGICVAALRASADPTPYTLPPYTLPHMLCIRQHTLRIHNICGSVYGASRAEHVPIWSVKSIKAGGGAWLGMSLPQMLQANLDGCMQHSLIQGDVMRGRRVGRRPTRAPPPLVTQWMHHSNNYLHYSNNYCDLHLLILVERVTVIVTWPHFARACFHAVRNTLNTWRERERGER